MKTEKLLEEAKTKLDADESIELYAEVLSEKEMQTSFLLTATQKRLFLYAKRLFGYTRYESYYYSSLNSVNFTKDNASIFLPYKITINMPNATYTFKTGKNRERLENIAKYANEKINASNNNFSQSSDITLQIEKLADLKNKGILSEEEFNKKKEELLSRM